LTSLDQVVERSAANSVAVTELLKRKRVDVRHGRKIHRGLVAPMTWHCGQMAKIGSQENELVHLPANQGNAPADVENVR
jgi:hypothetical protein